MWEIALAGNPNTGKTTLFNVLTGARAHVGNYPGITVEHRRGVHVTATGERWQVHDLPGCYSLSAHSAEEEIAHHALVGRVGGRPFDVAVVVLDATNLARNLHLLLQVAELGVPVVGALNMMDGLEETGVTLDVAALERLIGCPLVPMVARRGQGVEALQAAIATVIAGEGERIADTDWPAEVRTAIGRTRELIGPSGADHRDGEILWWLATEPNVVERLEPGLGTRLAAAFPRSSPSEPDFRRLAIEARFARIDELLAQTMRRPVARLRTWTDRIDRVALHPVGGLLLFVLAMAILFQAVFAWVEPVMAGVDNIGAVLSGWIEMALPAGLLRSVLIDGVVAGIAGTLIFVPQIAVLFLGIALLEDTGYLARAAFLIDRVMSRFGLPGKAFVPLLSSMACNVPGIMATRTLPDRNDRLVTMLVAPLMTCSARLPVYTMVIAAVFAGSARVLGFLSLGGLIIAGMYLFGVVLALVAALVLRRGIAPGQSSALLLEMPPYRRPRLRSVGRAVWDRVWLFVRDTGTIIIALTVVLWALMTFPRWEPTVAERDQMVETARVAAPSAPAASIEMLTDHLVSRAQLERSIAGRLGRAIEPVISPLGFDWRIGIGLIGSFAAREVVIPVLGRVYGRGDDDLDSQDYSAGVGQSLVRVSGMTPLVGVSLMVFFAIALQCASTVAVIRRETNGWRWPLFALAYLNIAAWLASFCVYQVGSLLGMA